MTAHVRTVRGTAGAREDGAARSPLGRNPQGRRLRRRVSGPTKAAVQDALKELRKEIDGGITKAGAGNYTVRRCCEDWLDGGLPGRDPKTVAKNKFVLEPVLAVIGGVRLRDLDVTDVDRALAAVAATRSSATVAMAHLALTRAITRAQAHEPGAAQRVRADRDAAGTAGETEPQHDAGAGGRGDRRRQGGRAADPCVCDAVAVHGGADRGSAGAAVGARRLRRPRQRAAAARERRGVAIGAGQGRHQDQDFPAHPRPAAARGHGAAGTARGVGPGAGGPGVRHRHRTAPGCGNVRRFFRAVCTAAGIGPGWTPRELRHTFVSLMSDSDVAVEEIARLVGHASSKVTETVYRHQLRPVMTTGAEKMDALLRGA